MRKQSHSLQQFPFTLFVHTDFDTITQYKYCFFFQKDLLCNEEILNFINQKIFRFAPFWFTIFMKWSEETREFLSSAQMIYVCTLLITSINKLKCSKLSTTNNELSSIDCTTNSTRHHWITGIVNKWSISNANRRLVCCSTFDNCNQPLQRRRRQCVASIIIQLCEEEKVAIDDFQNKSMFMENCVQR